MRTSLPSWCVYYIDRRDKKEYFEPVVLARTSISARNKVKRAHKYAKIYQVELE